MLVAGHYYTLKVNRISDYGLYLADEDGNEVLLPNRYVSVDYKPGFRWKFSFTTIRKTGWWLRPNARCDGRPDGLPESGR